MKMGAMFSQAKEQPSEGADLAGTLIQDFHLQNCEKMPMPLSLWYLELAYETKCTLFSSLYFWVPLLALMEAAQEAEMMA